MTTILLLCTTTRQNTLAGNRHNNNNNQHHNNNCSKTEFVFLHIIHLSCWRQLYSRPVENRCQRWSCFLLLLLIPRNIIFGHNSFSHTHSQLMPLFCTFVKFFASVSIKIIFFAIFCSHTLRHTIFNVVFVTTLPAQFIPIYSWRHYSLLHTVDNDLQFPEGEPATTPYFVCTWILWGYSEFAHFSTDHLLWLQNILSVCWYNIIDVVFCT